MLMMMFVLLLMMIILMLMMLMFFVGHLWVACIVDHPYQLCLPQILQRKSLSAIIGFFIISILVKIF